MARLVWFPAILLACAVVCSAKPVNDDVTDIELRMPGVQPTVNDTYLCLPMKMGQDNTYLTGFVPHANMSTAHHMLLFGCEEPGFTDKVWDCGEMMESTKAKDSSPPCMSMPKIVYAWAMDAPELRLPEGVGFKIGGDTNIKWLVLQVHYKDVTKFLPPISSKDSSGLTLHSTKTPQPKRAGVYLLSTGGQIPAHSTTYMEAACSINDKMTIHPFAYRVHAHVHGQVVAGYRIRDGQWTEIGRKSPKLPQMFYNVSTPGMTIKKGDIVAARCTMVNDEDRTVYVGQTQKDEMCNFYLMYWMSGDQTMNENYCTTAGPPSWYWSSISTIHLENSPSDISKIPGTDEILKATAEFADKVDNMIEETHNKLNEDLMGMLEQLREDEGEEEEQMNVDNQLPYEIENQIPNFNGYPEDIERLMYGYGRGGNERGGYEVNPYGEQDDYYKDERYYPHY